jgi:hypothetical protein
MKKYFLVSSILIILTLFIVGTASAALPGSGWWTSFAVQNVYIPIDPDEDPNIGTGSITMKAYSETDMYDSDPKSIEPFASLIYDPGRTLGGYVVGFKSTLPAGFEGSVVIEADKPLAAAAEIGNYSNGSLGLTSGTASAQYQAMGKDLIDTELRVPTVKHNYRNQTTSIYVQAAGAEATVTITYEMNDGKTYTQTKTIDANEMFLFDPANTSPNPIPSNCELGTDPNTSPCFGAATISSTSFIAATYVEHPHIGSPAPIALSTRAQTPADESTTLYGASVKHEYTTNAGTGITGDTIMNVGTEDALVKITLIVTKLGKNAPSGVSVGDVFTDTEVIAPGKSVVFSQWDNNLGGMPEGTFASVTYESIDNANYDPQPLVGASNDAKTLPLIAGGKGKTVYKLFADTTATDIAAVPILKEFVGDVTGALTVQNVGSSSDTIWFEFYPLGETEPYTFQTTEPLGPGEAINTWGISRNIGGAFKNDGSWNFSVLEGKEFSVKVYSDSGQPLICLVSENSPEGYTDIRNYEGFNIQ